MKKILRAIFPFIAIARNYTARERMYFFATYTWCLLTVAFYNMFHRSRILRARFLNYRISFFDFRTFTSLISEIFFHREYEFDSQRNDPYIIDCGSNIGMSVLYFKYRYPKARILAFEPDPYTFNVLERNIVQNYLQGVIAKNTALSDRDGTIPFYFDPKHSGSLNMSVIVPKETKKELTKITVKTETLSVHIGQDTVVDFLKMDIEGSEGMVLSDLEKSGALIRVREMVVEYHHDLARPENSLSPLLAILERAGFQTLVRSAHKRPPYAQYKHKPYTLLIHAYR